ncbi:hypothetical protein CH330_00350 [candidate division WOR-3 bacterium JGI_Cruoil_03_51_56]|uniref:Uncharacterized protein n=1 Tax=candidate division WOR-3 bacterium JGI_Cruoil_03_51_56 TaxID=1973747 RepID=A0A235BYY5_UNCW3|nr:MAG: hypothetical protein CH330_00350 [candidate division WOR-3 bacterium JGI_Cruoil_03_51_56]
MHLSPDLWVWVGALLTLFVFSFLFGDNPFYKFAEHLYVGVSVGYMIAIYYWNFFKPDLIEPLFGRGELILIVPLILGLCYLAIFIQKFSWVVRIPMGFVLGWGSGIAIPAVLQANVIKQIQGSLITSQTLAHWNTFVWSIVVLIGVITTVIYFFFSREQKGSLKVVANIGIIYIMIGFGASFGYTVMARISLLLGRLQFLLRDWLGVIH